MALRLEYFVGETVSNLRRNLLLTLAAISTVAVSLFLLGGVMVLGRILDNMAGTWEGKVEVSVFLRDDATPEQAKELEAAIDGMPEVAKWWYVSQDQAFNEYKEMFEDSPSLYENVDPSALPASFRIKLKDPEAVETVSGRIEGRPGVDEVNFGGEGVKRLLSVIGLLRTLGVVLTAIVLAAAVLLIAVTIQLAIYARRREIGIMKLVGATNWFIRVPFVFEGMTEAALGAMAAAAMVYATKLVFLDPSQELLVFFPITVGGAVVARVALLLLGVGVAIGAVVSALSLRRFLEV